MWSQFVTGSQSKRNTKTTPYAFTEQGLAMLSAIVNSDKAWDISGMLPKGSGGIFEIIINSKDGRVIKLIRGK